VREALRWCEGVSTGALEESGTPILGARVGLKQECACKWNGEHRIGVSLVVSAKGDVVLKAKKDAHAHVAAALKHVAKLRELSDLFSSSSTTHVSGCRFPLDSARGEAERRV